MVICYGGLRKLRQQTMREQWVHEDCFQTDNQAGELQHIFVC